MSQTRTGPQRLTGGLAPGWRIAHKTGTGQVLGATQAGYNDIGILTSPDGRHYAVAVMIGRTAAPIPARMELMQNVTRAVIAYRRGRAAATRRALQPQVVRRPAPPYGGAMARPQSPDYDKRRDAILAAAARLYARRGFQGASVADLAKACKHLQVADLSLFPVEG